MGKSPKSSISIGFSLINHPFLGIYPYFWKHPYAWHDIMTPIGMTSLIAIHFFMFFFILHSAFWLLRQCHPTSAVNQTFVRCWDVKSYSVDAFCQNVEPCWTIKPLLDMWIPEVTLSEREYFENSTCWDLINPCGIFVACMIKPPSPQAQSTNHTKPALLQPWNSPKPSVHGLANRY